MAILGPRKVLGEIPNLGLVRVLERAIKEAKADLRPADLPGARLMCWMPECWRTTASQGFGSQVLFQVKVRRCCVCFGLLVRRHFVRQRGQATASISTELATPEAKAPSPLSALPAHSIVNRALIEPQSREERRVPTRGSEAGLSARQSYGLGRQAKRDAAFPASERNRNCCTPRLKDGRTYSSYQI